MPFNDQISRTDAQSLIPEDVSRQIVESVPQRSAVMQLGQRLPNMPRNKRRIPVLGSLVQAYFVSGDTGMKQTSDQSWKDVFVTAEEIAVIVPIPETVLDDQDYDIWGMIRPRIEEAIGKTFDAAVIHGTNAPASWPTNLVAGSAAAGHSVSAAAATGVDLYDDILGENGTLQFVEKDGYMVSAHVGAMAMKSKLRGLRDANGQPIFLQTLQQAGQYMLDGRNVEFPTNGSINAAALLLLSGDWTQLVWAIRQDITYKLLDQAVITDSAGDIVFNLPQQDMVALRAVFRAGWALPNPINRMNEVDATRYPFATYIP